MKNPQKVFPLSALPASGPQARCLRPYVKPNIIAKGQVSATFLQNGRKATESIKKLSIRHLWRVDVGTSFPPTRPLPSTADQAAHQAISHPLWCLIKNTLGSALHRTEVFASIKGSARVL